MILSYSPCDHFTSVADRKSLLFDAVAAPLADPWADAYDVTADRRFKSSVILRSAMRTVFKISLPARMACVL